MQRYINSCQAAPYKHSRILADKHTGSLATDLTDIYIKSFRPELIWGFIMILMKSRVFNWSLYHFLDLFSFSGKLDNNSSFKVVPYCIESKLG